MGLLAELLGEGGGGGEGSRGWMVIRELQEGSGIESNLGHSRGLATPPHTPLPSTKGNIYWGLVDILFALTPAFTRPNGTIVGVALSHPPSGRKDPLIERISPFPQWASLGPARATRTEWVGGREREREG